MFQIKGPILRIFQLVLGEPSKLILDDFYKSLRIATTFAEKDLKFSIGYNNIQPFIFSMQAFILYPVSANPFVNKKGRKGSIVISISSSNIKMIFTLLAKLIVIQMRFFENTNQGSKP